ncbi:MAG: tyrosine-type recombinase/integrase, partial [SAR202 cluster bacterium]|nr:tyrosine-type recombinase/integrase [SAR202 cluster bacterium]
LTKLAIEALQRRRIIQLEERLAASTEWDNQFDLVLTNLVGNPLNPSNFSARDFPALLRRSGVKRIRFHDLRHSTASLLLSLDVHPKIVQELLGHSTIGVTMDIYSHSMPSLQEEAVTRLDGLLAP